MPQTLTRVRGVSLRELLPSARFIGGSDIRITSVSGDSRACQPGDLFAAMVGACQDGHDFVRDAIRRGATAVVSERLVAASVPTCIVPDSREAYGRLCHALAGDPSRQMNVVGVTGTNGKTTTSLLIAAVLSADKAPVGVTGTLAYSDSIDSAPSTLTTPPASELAHWLSRSAANGCRHAVVEVSSHGLAQRRTAGIEFDAAVLTNIRRDHLDYHGSLLNYRNVKRRLFSQLRPGGFAVVNADDPASKFILPKLTCPVMTVGMMADAEITATVIERHKSEQTFLLTAGSDTIPVRTRMIGDHHVANCLAAAAVGLTYGLDLPTVARGLESVEYVPGRLERIECGQPFGVFVDYAHTPDALAVVLKTLRRVTRGRLICVYGAGGDRDREKRPLMGRVVERGADLGIVTNDNPRTEEPLQIIHDILDGYERPARAHVLPDREQAIIWALGQAREGDTVLIAGKGHEDCQVVGHRRYEFNDADIARGWLYESAADLGTIHEQG